jgi:hypothetical protein
VPFDSTGAPSQRRVAGTHPVLNTEGLRNQ